MTGSGMVAYDWLAKPAAAAVKGLFDWQSRHVSHVVIRQDRASPLAQNLYGPVPGGLMVCVGEFLVTNYSGREIMLTDIECRSERARTVHQRWLNLGEGRDWDEALPTGVVSRLRIEFCLDPAPDWHGSRPVKLHLQDSLGKRHKVRAIYQPAPATGKSAPAS